MELRFLLICRLALMLGRVHSRVVPHVAISSNFVGRATAPVLIPSAIDNSQVFSGSNSVHRRSEISGYGTNKLRFASAVGGISIAFGWQACGSSQIRAPRDPNFVGHT